MRILAVTGLFLLAVLTLTNTWALQSGSVTPGTAVVTVATTDQALLGLEVGTNSANAAGTAYMSGGELRLDFTKGYLSNGGYGFMYSQGTAVNSAYRDVAKYLGLFHVVNRSDETLRICVYVPLDSPAAEDLDGVYLRGSDGMPVQGYPVAGARGQKVDCMPVAGGGLVYVDFWWRMRPASNAQTGVYPFNVRVEAIRP